MGVKRLAAETSVCACAAGWERVDVREQMEVCSFSTRIGKPGCTLESATGVSGNCKNFKGFNLRSLEDRRVLWTQAVLGLFQKPQEAARKASAWACMC